LIAHFEQRRSCLQVGPIKWDDINSCHTAKEQGIDNCIYSDIIPLGVLQSWVHLYGKMPEYALVTKATSPKALLRLAYHIIELLFLLLDLERNFLSTLLDTEIMIIRVLIRRVLTTEDLI
jgi:hypothetical protein